MKKIIITVTGPSGTGKSTLFEKILGKENEITSFTTRERRVKAGEIDGIHYHFITKEKFNELKENGGLFEKSEYAGEFYGITEE
jgi:guanylate kinase